jgi:hypothetical protein
VPTDEETEHPEDVAELRRSRRQKRLATAVAKLRRAYYGAPYLIERRSERR